jgi:hypothetical protein
MAVPPLIVAILAAAGALAAGATALSRPRTAFGILFLLASISSATIETPVGTMRPEMPAIAVVAAVLFAGGRFRTLLSLPRSTLAMALAFGTYLGVLALSSALVAPGTAQSLRMVAWLATSMVGGIVAFVLVRPRPVGAIEPLAFAGAAMGAVGVAVAAMFFAAGPAFNLGIQDPNSILPRVHALGWETNLYASFLAMCAFFALEATRGPRRAAGVAMLALVLVGFPLGITRGAYVGLAAGVLAYVAVRLALERRPGDLVGLGAMSAVLLVLGIAASNVLLPNLLERAAADGRSGQGPSGSPGPSASLAPPSGAPTVAPSGAPTVAPSGAPTVAPSGAAPSTSTPATVPTLTLAPYPDTMAFRLERVPIALEDLRRSPLIGFGAESFGQLHPDRYAGAGADHIAILAVVVPYEAGIIGAAALLIGFALLLTSLWKSARRSSGEADWRAVGAAAAFIGSVVSVLVAYQVTNALHLAINWIVIGAAAALTAREASRDPASPDG